MNWRRWLPGWKKTPDRAADPDRLLKDSQQQTAEAEELWRAVNSVTRPYREHSDQYVAAIAIAWARRKPT